MALMILTIIGPDRPGLVRGLSQALADAGGNWLESRLARLAGQFAGIIMVDAPAGFADQLTALQQGGLRISLTLPEGTPGPHHPGPRLLLEVVGNDRPGIVHEVTAVLAAHHVNIEDMTTTVTSGAFSGAAMFRAEIIVGAPDDSAAEQVVASLERIGADVMVDIQRLEEKEERLF